jgi:Na+/proline symporter
LDPWFGPGDRHPAVGSRGFIESRRSKEQSGMSNIYLSAFFLYSALILCIGIWGYRRSSLSSFAVAERKMGLLLATGTFMATFISAVTVIGVSGYASRSGWAAAAFSCYGYALGWILLVTAAGRLHRTELSTVPEFLHLRFDSVTLRVFAAAIIILMYSLVLMVQLLAMGITLTTLAGLSTPVAILVVGAVFVTYTMLGGLAAVIRTDMVQSVLLGTGVLLGAATILVRTRGAVITAPPEHLSHFFGGNIHGLGDFFGWMLVWGLGIPTESYYLHRFYASRDARVARLQVGIGGVFLMVILLSVIMCGVGAGMLNPPDHLGDAAFPYLFKTVIGGWVSVPILFAITAAVQSSSSGLLHIVGLYFALDIYKQAARNATDARLLRISRWSTLLFGATITGASMYVANHSVPLISLLAGISWGGMASTMFVPVFAGLFWPRATRAGALASAVGGFTFAIIGFALRRAGVIGFHEIYPGVIASLLLMIIVSGFSAPQNTPLKQSLFPAMGVKRSLFKEVI